MCILVCGIKVRHNELDLCRNFLPLKTPNFLLAGCKKSKKARSRARVTAPAQPRQTVQAEEERARDNAEQRQQNR